MSEQRLYENVEMLCPKCGGPLRRYLGNLADGRLYCVNANCTQIWIEDEK